MSNSKLIARTEGEKNGNFLGTGQQIPSIERSLTGKLAWSRKTLTIIRKKKANKQL